MYDYIKGKYISKADNVVVIDNNGIGYRIISSSRAMIGDIVTIYTYLNVREGVFELYGFDTLEERRWFLMLIGVNGVGPKAAVSVLAALSPAELNLAVASGDAKAVTAAQGVGPKLAQRIVLELKDKADVAACEIPDQARHHGTGGSVGVNDEALAALLALGYSAIEAQGAIARASGDSIEEIVMSALKGL